MDYLLDADILTYRAAAVSEELSQRGALQILDTFITDILTVKIPAVIADVRCYQGYLTYSRESNYRHAYAQTAPYKGQRQSKRRPKHYEVLREYMVDHHGFIMVSGQEADDAIGIEAMKDPDNSCIVSIDKDFFNIPCWNFNYVTNRLKRITPEQAARHFYTQILTGDVIDNVKGVHGIGPVKAAALLAYTNDAMDVDTINRHCWETVVEEMGREWALENARLLWIRQKPDQIWEPPT